MSQDAVAEPALEEGAEVEGEGPARRVIAHCDIDAFYASVELQRRPELKGQPVIVGGLGPRSVVTTASYEARAFGVGSAMPMARAKRLCPHAVVIPPDMALYRERSRQVWSLVRERFDTVQQAGIDEAYVDCTDVERPLAALRAMVADVEEATGLVVSVGIGPNRLIAKTTSGAAKPRGFAALSREQACEHFAPSPVGILGGIGPRTQERLAELGIRTIGELQRADPEHLSARVGTGSGGRLLALAHFRDRSPVKTSRDVKSSSRESTFPADLSDRGEQLAALLRLAERLAEDLAGKDLAGRTIGIKVRLADWSTRTRARTLDEPTRDPEVLRSVARELFEHEAIDAPIRLLGVRCAGFGATRPGGPATTRSAPAGQLELPLA